MFRLYHRGGAIIGEHLTSLPRPLPEPHWLWVISPASADEAWLAIHGLAPAADPPQTLVLPWPDGQLTLHRSAEGLVTVTPPSFLPGAAEGWNQNPSCTLAALLEKALDELAPQVSGLGEEADRTTARADGSREARSAHRFDALVRRAGQFRSLLEEWDWRLAEAGLTRPARLGHLLRQATAIQETLRELRARHLYRTLTWISADLKRMAAVTALTLLALSLTILAVWRPTWPGRAAQPSWRIMKEHPAASPVNAPSAGKTAITAPNKADKPLFRN